MTHSRSFSDESSVDSDNDDGELGEFETEGEEDNDGDDGPAEDITDGGDAAPAALLPQAYQHDPGGQS